MFCNRLERASDEQDYILHRGQRSFVILNAFPYINGHLMIVPFDHVADIEALDDETMTEMHGLLKRSVVALKQTFGAEGFNIGWNIGKCAGAGVQEHIHEHVVPRWSGDTNFMPVIAGTSVLPSSLPATWQALKPHF